VIFNFLGIFNKINEKEHSPDNVTYFLIKIDDDLLNIIADRLNLQVYNKKRKILESFVLEQANEYELFNSIHIQEIILHLISLEFDIDYFVEEKVIIEHGPLHNFAQRKQILKQFRANAVHVMKDIIPFR
jgi:hypothetical protein